MNKLILLALTVITFTSCTEKGFYNEKEVESFKKGDTIYFKRFYSIEKYIVIENIKQKKLLEIKEVGFHYSMNNIFTYEHIMFQDK